MPRDAYYQTVHWLRGALPRPVSDRSEDLIRRDNAAIAQVAAMLPANADEASIAAASVAASAQALDCLRLAQEGGGDIARILRCTAQAASMMGQSRGARTLLARLQTQREKREANQVSLGKAEAIEYSALGLMAMALGRPLLAAMPEPLQSPATPEPAHEPAHEPAPSADLAEQAEQCAIIYPRRAALIRAHGGLPDDGSIAPMPAALVHAIVTGTGPHLRALDRQAAPG